MSPSGPAALLDDDVTEQIEGSGLGFFQVLVLVSSHRTLGSEGRPVQPGL